VTALNKIDLLESISETKDVRAVVTERLGLDRPDFVLVSAVTGKGINELLEHITSTLRGNHMRYKG